MEHRFNNYISAAELKEKLSKDVNTFLLDVREPIEYHTFNIGGKNIPLGNLTEQLEGLKSKVQDEVIVICQHGIRSETARLLLVDAGFKKVRNLTGGLVQYRRMS